MYRRASETGGAPRAPGASGGFTLIEVLVGVVVSGLLVVGITRFFTDSHRTYNLREKIAERDLNGQYVLKHLEDRIMEAGANLPDSGMAVISAGEDAQEGFSVAMNPRGGVQLVYTDRAASTEVPLDDHEGFRDATHILILRADPSKPAELAAIATGHGDGGYRKGIKDEGNAQDTLKLDQPRAFRAGDRFYAYARQDYAFQDGRFMARGVVLAENIEDLALTFHDAQGNPTTDWNAMRSARLSVTVRTSEPDPANAPDTFRRATLTSEVRMRNRH